MAEARKKAAKDALDDAKSEREKAAATRLVLVAEAMAAAVV
jgi:F-type H+-transporting ATPase subunit epsilon